MSHTKRKMKFKKAVDIVREAKISDREDDLTFMSAVIILIGGYHDWNLDKLHKVTGYRYDAVETILKNLYENNIIEDGKLNMDFYGTELENVIELTLVALCGAGEVVRREESEIVELINSETNNFDKMEKRKTLNDHLFDTLDRLSNATPENINTEVTKAAAIISVSEQVINAARLKLQILQADIVIADEFKEIDDTQATDSPKQIQQSPFSDKKKENEVLEDEENPEELVNYGGRMISRKALGNHKTAVTSTLHGQ